MPAKKKETKVTKEPAKKKPRSAAAVKTAAKAGSTTKAVTKKKTVKKEAVKKAPPKAVRKTKAAPGKGTADPHGESFARGDELSLDQVSRQFGPQGPEYRVVEEPADLPGSYGKTRIVALMVDPDWIHTFWEVTGETLGNARDALGKWYDSAVRNLRVKRIDGPEDESSVLEQFYIEIGDEARSWYLRVPRPEANYQVEIGLLTANGDFFTLARSNVLRIPRRGMSDVIDEQWTNVEDGYFEKIYALSGGFQVGMGSLQLQEKMSEFLRGEISSGALGSFALGSGAIGGRPGERAFWFRVGAELIVYGATDPRAKVTLLGEPLKLRSDGTFSVRFALPDGTRGIPISAESPDGVEERHVKITVERETVEKEPVLK